MSDSYVRPAMKFFFSIGTNTRGCSFLRLWYFTDPVNFNGLYLKSTFSSRCNTTKTRVFRIKFCEERINVVPIDHIFEKFVLIVLFMLLVRSQFHKYSVLSSLRLLPHHHPNCHLPWYSQNSFPVDFFSRLLTESREWLKCQTLNENFLFCIELRVVCCFEVRSIFQIILLAPTSNCTNFTSFRFYWGAPSNSLYSNWLTIPPFFKCFGKRWGCSCRNFVFGAYLFPTTRCLFKGQIFFYTKLFVCPPRLQSAFKPINRPFTALVTVR